MIERALSIQQPFAELIIAGRKKYEFRTINTKIRERIYIYTSQTDGPHARWEASGYKKGTLQKGVIIGSVEISGNQGTSGNYKWKLTVPRRLKVPLKPKNKPQPVWFRPFTKQISPTNCTT